MNKYKNVNVDSLRGIINNIKEGLSKHKNDISSVQNIMYDNIQWKCSAKDILMGKLSDFTANNHDKLESDYDRAENIFKLLEDVQKLYKEYEECQAYHSDLMSQYNSLVQNSGYQGIGSYDVSQEQAQVQYELGKVSMRMHDIVKECEQLEEQIEKA